MTVKTECSYSAADLGKNLYRKRTYYTVLVEQEVIARDQDEADTLFLDNGGIWLCAQTAIGDPGHPGQYGQDHGQYDSEMRQDDQEH